MIKRLAVTTCLLLVACCDCRKSASPASQPVHDPIKAQKVAQSFGHLKNARLVALNKTEQPMQGHVNWALSVGEHDAYLQCRRELIFCELALEQLPRQRAALVFAHLKNARLSLMGMPEEPVDGHIQWAKKASDEEFKLAVQKNIRDLDNSVIQMYGE